MNKKCNEFKFKYILVGNAFVGKTKISYRFRTGNFDEKYNVTLNAEYASHKIKINGKTINIQLWDISGSHEFRAISKEYFKKCVCAIVVYDITNRKSFNDIKEWLEECKKNGTDTEMLVLVGNKSDLNDQRNVQTNEGEEYAEKNGMKFFETSALNGSNIKELFEETGQEILDNINKDYYDLSTDDCGIEAKWNIKQDIKNINVKDEQIIKGGNLPDVPSSHGSCPCSLF